MGSEKLARKKLKVDFQSMHGPKSTMNLVTWMTQKSPGIANIFTLNRQNTKQHCD